MRTRCAVLGACLIPVALAAQNAVPFSFDTSAKRSVNVTTSNINAISDACYMEMRATVVNLGVTNASCHVVYIPSLPGNFASSNALQVDATASHVRNGSGQTSANLNASAALQTCRVVTPGSSCWAATLVSEDTAGAVGVLNGVEVDMNLQNRIPSYTGSAANPVGVRAVMVGSNSGAIGTGFVVQTLGPGLSAARWSTGFLTRDSAASTGLSLGSSGSSAKQGGQPIVLHYRDDANTDKWGQINVDAAGNLLLRAGNNGDGTATINQNSLFVSNGRLEDETVDLTCGANPVVTVDAARGNYFTCNITSDVAVTIQAPANNPPASRSQVMTIAIRNTSGGPLRKAPTFSRSARGYRFSAVTNPANNTQVLYTYRWDPGQSLWYEVGTHQAAG